MSIIPRGVMPALPQQLEPLSIEDLGALPQEILEVTGPNPCSMLTEQGRANLTLRLVQGQRDYLLKVAQGEYRCRELAQEQRAMEFLSEFLPVPSPLLFLRQGNLAYQVRTFVPGQPLSRLMKEEPENRGVYVAGLAQALASIHAFPVSQERRWQDWLADMLATAEQNMLNQALDPQEFSQESPLEMLDWLKANKPEPGPVVMIHGDWRPKNILWAQGVSAIIDWAFCDLGDPWYDLAIGLWYLSPEERETFFAHYPLAPDPQREYYFERLARFTGV